jgi:hypothetical protein
MMPFMPYQHDEQARQEARAHSVSDASAEGLTVLCAEELARLGDDGLGGHHADFRVTGWQGLPGVPVSSCAGGRITRDDLLDIGGRVRAGELSPVTLLQRASPGARG